MMLSADINRARMYYYEFFAIPFFFSEKSDGFTKWQEQLKFLSQNPLNETSLKAFENLAKFDFSMFKSEQNDVLFDLSYVNVPLNVSFYEEGRDDGAARLRVIDLLKRSGYKRDRLKCDDSEDFVGFVFYAAATLLKGEISNGVSNEFSTELFSSVINGFVDEFCDMLKKHKKVNFFASLSEILQGFISLERSLLDISEPKRDTSKDSVAQISLNKQPYQTKMPTQKSKINWDEFTAL